MTFWTIACGAVGVILAGPPLGAGGPLQGVDGFVPVGVRYQAPDDPGVRRRDLERMQQLRFNVVKLASAGDDTRAGPLMFIDRVLAGAPDPRVMLPLDSPATIVIGPRTQAPEVTLAAWTALTRTAGGVIFADWTTLLGNPDALVAAAQFADAIARNAALYAPLRPARATAGERRVRTIGGGDTIEATLLESPDALVLIAVNRSAREQTATMAFSPDVPEAIWQNMLASGAVNFVAGPEGPFYERSFPPHDVLVLMIRKGRS